MRKTSWSLTISIAIFALTVGVVATYFAIEQSQPQIQMVEVEEEDYGYDDELEEFLEFLNHFRTAHYFYDEDNDLIRGAIDGMAASTDDPWARLLTVEEYWALAGPLLGGFYGVGVRIIEVDGYAIIAEVLPDSPAEKNGLLPGDAIISVEGDRFDEYEFEDFIDKLLGRSGTSVTLEIQRASDLFQLDIIRGYIDYEDVTADIFEYEDKMIGYIRISSFGMYTQSDFSDAIAELEEEGIDGLVIDIRDNPGGSLATLNTMINYLLPNDRIILTTINRDGRENTQRTRGDDRYRLDVDIVTLINGYSASASEIFAAAMIESGGFEVIGTTSFGKGTAQSPMHVGDHILISTLHEGLTPTGNPIEGYGVVPTIYVEASEFYDFSPIHLSRDIVFEYDMVDVRISNAQLILEALGYDVDRTDGYFDASTAEAMHAFQRSNELDETGDLNPETATALSVALFDKLHDPAYDTQLLMAFEFLTGDVK